MKDIKSNIKYILQIFAALFFPLIGVIFYVKKKEKGEGMCHVLAAAEYGYIIGFMIKLFLLIQVCYG